MSSVLKQDGILLASTVPRVTGKSGGYQYETDEGFFKDPKDASNTEAWYYRDRNVFDVGGNIVPAGELVQILNDNNKDFRFEYSVSPGKDYGTIHNGGQISGQRLSNEGGLNLSNMFYCTAEGELGYIVARTPEEIAKLKAEGYVCVQDRFDNKEGDTAPIGVELDVVEEQVSETN